jgi:hypothetical protein
MTARAVACAEEEADEWPVWEFAVVSVTEKAP